MKRVLLIVVWWCLASTVLRGQDAPPTDPLALAASRGDLAALTHLLDAGQPIDARSPKGWTPLTFAVRAGQTAAVRLLLSRHANVNALTYAGCSPLDFAVGFDHVDIARSLLEAGADANSFRVTNPAGETYSPLMQACERQNNVMVELLLDHGARIEDRSNLGNTALMMSSRWRPNASLVKLLIEKGANINARSNQGQTALIYAAYNGFDETVRLLLDRGADWRLTAQDDPSGPTYDALEVANQQGQPYALEMLTEAGARPTVKKDALNDELNAALSAPDFERAQAALAKGASATQPDSYDVLPLTVAVLQGDPGLVRLLIDAGADVNADVPGKDHPRKLIELAQEQIASTTDLKIKANFARIAEMLRQSPPNR